MRPRGQGLMQSIEISGKQRLMSRASESIHASGSSLSSRVELPTLSGVTLTLQTAGNNQAAARVLIAFGIGFDAL